MRRSFIILMLFISLCSISSAENFHYGFGVNQGLLLGTSSYQQSNVENCCPEFNIFDGNIFNVKALAAFEISTDYSIFSNLSLSKGNYRFTKTERETIGLNNELIEGKFKHLLEYDIKSVGLNIGISYNYKNIVLGSSFGIFYPLLGKYKQFEEIVYPKDRGVFLDNYQRRRNEASGSSSDYSKLIYSIDLNARYLFKLNRKDNLFLAPSLSICKLLNEPIKQSNTQAYNLSAGISMIYYPSGKSKRISELLKDNFDNTLIKLDVTTFQLTNNIEELLKPLINNIFDVDYTTYLDNYSTSISRLFPSSFQHTKSINSDGFKFYIYENQSNTLQQDKYLIINKNNELTSFKQYGSSLFLSSNQIFNLIDSSSSFRYYPHFAPNVFKQDEESRINIQQNNILNINHIIYFHFINKQLLNTIKSIIKSNRNAWSIRIHLNDKNKELEDALKDLFIDFYLNHKLFLNYSEDIKPNTIQIKIIYGEEAK